jgi:hypothetical protein
MTRSQTPQYSSLPNINNTTNGTLTDIIGDAEIGNMNIGQRVSISGATMGGIGAGIAAVAIIAAAIAYSIFSKKKPVTKGKTRNEPFSEINKLEHTVRQQNKLNIIRPPIQAERINLTGLPHTNRVGSTTSVMAPPSRVAFNPVSAAAMKAVGTTPAARVIQQAIPLEMYRGHNINLDRMSVRRPATNVKLPSSVNESRVGFQPVRKDYRPQLAKTSLAPNARNAQLLPIGK